MNQAHLQAKCGARTMNGLRWTGQPPFPSPASVVPAFQGYWALYSVSPVKGTPRA